MHMEEFEIYRTPNPRRRKRSKLQVFKEAYLPLIIVAVTFVLLVVFIVGGLSRQDAPGGSLESTTGSTDSDPTTSPTDPSTALLQQEAQLLMQEAALLIPDYDYEGALAILDTFSGDMAAFPQLQAVYDEYTARLEEMVPWSGNQVVNLSMHLLIADPERAFNDPTYGQPGQKSYLKNFITTTELSNILQQLYQNGYILVSLDDLYELQYDASSGRDVYVAKTLLLPPGKTPVMLTETNANYYNYMTDSNGDGKPDAGADGFAYKLCHDGTGFYNALIMADGTVATGAFDLVPILEAFIGQHPDFSYRGARAIIAVTGYDGVLGYRINSKKLTEAEKEAERTALAALVEQLKNSGYEIGCFTYENWNYGEKEPMDIQSDLQKWADVVASVIGPTDIMVLPKEGDIAGEEGYNDNSKFNVMYNAGYRFFLGTGTESWDQVDERYVRHNKLMVTGAYLTQYPERFTALFDTATVLDPYRSNFT